MGLMVDLCGNCGVFHLLVVVWDPALYSTPVMLRDILVLDCNVDVAILQGFLSSSDSD